MRQSSRKRKSGQFVGLSTGLAAALVGTPALVLAQAADQSAEQSAAKGAPEELETVEVTGTRASLKSAIERKRAAATVSDSIVAEDIAQFPDKNVGEALSRVTGVQLSRDFGEGVQVSIRGVDPALNRIEINGMSVLTANGGSSRAADFREFASELIKTVDVVKGSTADMTEGGIGGTVMIELRKPLELDGPLVSATASLEQLNVQGGVEPRGNLTAAAQLFDGHFGIMANVTYDHVLTRQDYLRNTEWVRLADWDDSAEKTIESLNPTYAAQTTEAGCMTLPTADQNPCRQQWWDYSPRIPRYGIWLRDDKRTSAQLTLQLKVNEQNNFWIEGTHSERDQFLNDHNFGTDFTATDRVTAATNLYDGMPAAANLTMRDHHIVGYTISNQTTTSASGGTNNSFGTSARGFDLNNKTKYYNGGYEYAGEKLQAKFVMSTVDSFRNDDTNAANFTARVPGLRVDLDEAQGFPRFTFPNGLSMDDDSAYYTMQLQYRPSENELKERQASLDFDWKTETPFISSLEAGFQKRKTTSLLFSGGGYLDAATGVNVPTLNINLTGNLVPGTQANTSTPGTAINAYNMTYGWNTATFLEALSHTRRSPGTFYDSYGDTIAGIPADWRVPIFADLAPMFDTSRFTHEGLREISVNGVMYDQLPGHNIEERTLANYFKVNFDSEFWGMRLRGNVGIREVNTETDSGGSLTRRERRPGAAPGTFTDVTVGNSYVEIARNYSDTLPSANLALEISEDYVIRMGFAELMSRPAIADLAPAVNCLYDLRPGFSTDTDADDCTAGNPNLRPYRAKSYDLEFAWYPSDEVEMRLGAFYKDIETFILARTLVRNVELFGDGTLFDVTMPINGAGAKTQGLEASVQAPFTFLPGWASGFGGIANYTYSEAKDVGLFSQLDGSRLPFPGLSKDSYNLVLYYDKGPINARVAWNSRTDWLQAAADRSGNPVYRAGEDYLDARVQWRIKGDSLSVFLEGKNLTDQASILYAGERIRLSEIGWAGRRYFLGVSWKPIS